MYHGIWFLHLKVLRQLHANFGDVLDGSLDARTDQTSLPASLDERQHGESATFATFGCWIYLSK